MNPRELRPGSHVRHEHKSRISWGIVRKLVPGLFGEPRAEIDWVGCEGSPFPVCVEDLTPDRAGVVRGTLGAAKEPQP